MRGEHVCRGPVEKGHLGAHWAEVFTFNVERLPTASAEETGICLVCGTFHAGDGRERVRAGGIGLHALNGML